MHENAPTLEARKRERLGSRYARRDRDGGRLPAVVYGHKEDPVAVTVDAHDALHLIHKGEKVFNLSLGEATQVVLLKDVQFDHLGTSIIHCDFARVELDERVHARIPVHLFGEAKGLKHAGAIMMHTINEVDLECPVRDLPDSLEVDITELDTHHAITVGEIPLPESARLLSDPNAILAQIVLQRAIKGADEVGEEQEVAAEEAPEVLSEKKEEEEAG
jgi:large subunit ribosomal protein L25